MNTLIKHLEHRKTTWQKAAFSRSNTAALVAAFLLFPLLATAQGAGGGAGAGGAAGGAAGTGGVSAGSGTVGAPGGQAGQGSAQAGPNSPQAYAAGAALGPDPRKPPASKPGALTLQQVIDAARAKNPTLLAAQQNLNATRAQELQAAVRTNPYFTLYGTNITEPQSAPNPDTYSAQVSRLFERGNKRTYRMDFAKATTAQTQAQLEDTIRQTILTLKTAFTTMLIAKDAQQLSAATLKDFRHEVEISNDRYQAGDLSKLDFERLDLQLGDFESDQSNDVVTLQQASAQLQTLMGVAQPSQDFDIKGEVVPPTITQDQAQLTQAALAARPDYAAARFAVTAADANAKLAIANGTADPTVEAEYDRNGTENSVGASINIPLRIFDKNQGNKETARFQADASRFTEQAARNQVVSDVAQAWVGYTEAKRLSDRFTTHYLDESQDVLSIAQFAFEHGGIALIDYLDALRDSRSSISDALHAYQNTWLAIHQLSASSAVELVP